MNVIPPEVKEIIEKQKKQWEEEQTWKLEQSKMMAVKVHYILNVIVLQVLWILNAVQLIFFRMYSCKTILLH